MQLTNIMNIENDKIGSVIHKRLSELCKELKISERKFSTSIGKSPSYISSLNKDITSEVLHNISVKYKHVNIMWIITGEGEMLNNKSTNINENISFADLINEYRLDIKELNNQIKELEKQKAELEQKLIQAKKHVLEEEDVTCANASGFDLAK